MKFLNSFQDLLIADLLLEGKLVASKRFLNKIENLSGNKVGEFLFSQFSSEEDRGDLAQNVVDITDKEDIITFMSDRAFAKLGKDSYDEEIFSAKGRSETRIGRFVRSLSTQLGQKFSDKEIEEFVNAYKASDTSKDNFKLVSGQDIKKYYGEDTYSRGGGTLGTSCMRYETCQDFFDIYVKNPNSCQMLVLFDKDDKILGRALVWKIFSKELNVECSAEYFMDRIYSIKDSDVLKFRKFATTRGWIYRKRDNNDSEFNSMVFVYKGETIWGKVVSELRPGLRIDEFPYVDSMTFLKGKYISNVGLGQDQKVLCDTDGSYDICGTCNNTGKQEIYRCQDCNGDGSIKCPKCRCRDCNDGYITCNKCDEGYVSCPDCDNGYNECSSCNGDGYLSCKTCNGNGSIGKCKKCNGQSITCKICNGEGEYYRKWGYGKRLVACTECGGRGEISPHATFVSKEESPNRCDCFAPFYLDEMKKMESQGFNSGREKCQSCKGEGSFNCEKCDGDGNIMCEKCDGEGTNKCKDCNGQVEWKCKKCDGGILNIKCNCIDGEVTCSSCKGTGVPKNSKVDCQECVDLLNSLKRSIKSGNFKL